MKCSAIFLDELLIGVLGGARLALQDKHSSEVSGAGWEIDVKCV